MDPFTWSVINVLLLVILIILVSLYLAKRENGYRRELLDKMDRMIQVLQDQKQQ
ncbi:MAG: hypothetical protein GXY34_13630 [Syntrophomonadaceae bacterium]|nr:hypothetical protein [Syntrophomonadaceae bacterium]